MLFFYINHLHGLAENVGHDRKGGRKMEIKRQEVSEVKFSNDWLFREQKKPEMNLVRYFLLIEGTLTIEDACALILSIPQRACTGGFNDDFFNGFYFLAELTGSEFPEIALCAYWAAVNTEFYGRLSRKESLHNTLYEEYPIFSREQQKADKKLFEEAVNKIALYLGTIGFPIHHRRYFGEDRESLTTLLVPQLKFNEVAKRFLKANYDCPGAGPALLEFRLYSELVKGRHFEMMRALAEFICGKEVEMTFLESEIQKVEASSPDDSMTHACSAWRRLKAMQKKGSRG